MKKLLSTFLFVPALSIAQTMSLDAYCLSLEKLTEIVVKHKEQPMLTFISQRGVDNKNSLQGYATILFVNPETKTYTIAERIKEDLYCITSVGLDIKPSTTRLNFDKKM